MILIDYLLKKYGTNKPILTEELSIPEISYANLRKQLSRYNSQGILEKYSQGVYYIPKETILGRSTLSIDDVINRKYITNDNDIYGFYSGLSFYNKLGISTQVPYVYEIVTNKEKSRVRETTLKNQNIILRKPYVKINKNNYLENQFLDFINNADSNDLSDNIEVLKKYIKDNNIPCPKCGKCDFTDIRQFKLMFETYRGVVKDNKSVVYLRPENAQGEYVNFLNVQRSMRCKLPFSIGQIGKAFRNEITPGNFTFRTIEFEQMEYQTFCKKGEDSKLYEYFKDYGKKFFMYLGLSEDKLRFHDHEKLAHYAKEACDIEYKFPFGWGEINGTHNRTDYDLSRHEEYSGIQQRYLDPVTNEKFIPYIIESTYGLDRTVLAVLFEHYHKEVLDNGEEREVLKLPTYLAPYKVAVLPLVKKYHSEKANEVYEKLSKNFMCTYDDTASIGKRYRREDVIGTPFCITVDDETINNNTVTVRDRDTMKQEVINLDDLVSYIEDKVRF